MAKANKSNKGSNNAVAVAEAPKKVKAYEPTVKVLRTIEVSPENLHTRSWIGRSRPVADDEVIGLADSLRSRQDQPIQVRELKGMPDNYEVIFGNTRTAAGRKIVEGFTTASGKVLDPLPTFTLRAEVVDIDDEEATMRNITENAQRVQTTDIDDAMNHEMLRTEYGMSDAAITRLYGYGHQASVTQLKKLLLLPENVQEKIHTGNMTKQAGFTLVDWCKKKEHVDAEGRCLPDMCEAILSKVSGGEDIGNVGSSEVINCIKEYEKSLKQPVAPEGGTTPAEGGTTPVAPEGGTTPAEGGTAPTAPATTTFALTLKEYKDTLTEFAGLPDQPQKMGEFCAVTLSYLKGEMEKDAYYEWLNTNMQ